ncbi:MAG: hypothetical protein KatS3mg115_0376 [Candidatus Poribacteria bacterium]|nr:MAG: hypothetical protein KatS3mg115_0376 [Candidatus Poribacteria bacterium]
MYRLLRELHLYVGLFFSPFLSIYAISAVLFNHLWAPPPAEEQAKTVRIALETLPPDGESLAQARALMRQLHLSGEVEWIHRRGDRWTNIRVVRPHESLMIEVDAQNQEAIVRTIPEGARRVLLFYHRMPGPHLVKVRRNWFVVRAWGWIADATVYAILLMTTTGLLLWWLLKAERTAGLLALGLGVLTFGGLVIALLG